MIDSFLIDTEVSTKTGQVQIAPSASGDTQEVQDEASSPTALDHGLEKAAAETAKLKAATRGTTTVQWQRCPSADSLYFLFARCTRAEGMGTLKHLRHLRIHGIDVILDA